MLLEQNNNVGFGGFVLDGKRFFSVSDFESLKFEMLERGEKGERDNIEMFEEFEV